MVMNTRSSISRQNTHWDNSDIITVLCILNPIAGSTPGYCTCRTHLQEKLCDHKKYIKYTI